MNVSDIVMILLLLLPGYLAWGLANFLTPNFSKKSEKQITTVQVSIGLAIVGLASMLHGLRPSDFVRRLKSPDYIVYWDTYGCFLFLTFAFGLAIAFWREK